MKQIKGCNALLTGSSRGIGVTIAKRLAEEGVHLSLAARDIEALQSLRGEIEAMGVRCIAVQTDLRVREELQRLVERTERDLGPIDLLINNAAVEVTAAFETLTFEEIETQYTVNLLAPTILSRLVLPGMLKRNRGHIVNISSLAGLIPIAYEGVYTSTKHGLIGLTMSLRAACQIKGSKVSASAVCPGFVTEAGMFHRSEKTYGIRVPDFLIGGTSTPKQVADAVISDITKDFAGTIVNKGPVRALVALGTIVPNLIEKLAIKSGLHDVSKQVAEMKGRG